MKHGDLTEHQKWLYSGDWVDDHPLANKEVTCIKCFGSYIIKDAPRTVPGTDGYYIREPACPKCGCRLYFSHL